MKHRDDLQGLRAVAVLLVVLNHAGVPFVRGGYVGVDVFFVLSGFLITGLLLAGARGAGHVSLLGFYVRRAKRILPAAALTLVVTDVAAYHLLNFVRAKQAVWDSIWASLFAANVHFSHQATDYFAQGQPPSPIQHFWSLSIEEQFYLVWPGLLSLALFGSVGLFRRGRRGIVTGRSLRRVVAVIAVGGALSLVWSIHETHVERAAAYFSTFARVWELALGAALACAADLLARAPSVVKTAAGWTGLAAIATAGAAFSGGTSFPGVAALLPTTGAALVIIAGLDAAPRFGAGRLLSLSPMRYIGDRSYAYYLWHWPVLIIAAEYAGHDLSTTQNLVLVALALLLSIASYRLFENPIRKMRWSSPVGVFLWPASAAAVLICAVLTLQLISSEAARTESAAAAVPRPIPAVRRFTVRSDAPLPGVLAAVAAARANAPIPSPLSPPIGRLLDSYYAPPKGCAPTDPQTSSKVCRLGNRSSKKLLVIVGDSHAQMWIPTLLGIAKRDRWAVVPLVKSACKPDVWIEQPSYPVVVVPSAAACRTWFRWVVRTVSDLRPTVTLVTGAFAGAAGPRADEVVKSLDQATTRLRRGSKRVVLVEDGPLQFKEPVDCLLAPGATMKTCSGQWPSALQLINGAVAGVVTLHGVGYIKTQLWFCAADVCPMVIGHTIVYRDRGHLTVERARELIPPFRAALRRALRRRT